ncbi:MAG: DNA mismatch repair protein [Saprospiraceae bacterium]|nr:DNA mismatch repair protein [Saprospiraceae bacterium]
MIPEFYSENQSLLQSQSHHLKKRFNLVSTIRLILGVGIFILLYLFAATQYANYGVGALACAAIFIVFVNWHQRLGTKKRRVEILSQVNNDEIAFLERKSSPFNGGAEFVNPAHAYSYDLDIFGPNSLFQHINRTGTYMGSKRLADALATALPTQEIPEMQTSVQELVPPVMWRQELLMMSRYYPDSKAVYEYLKQWSTRKSHLSIWICYTSILISLILLALIFLTIAHRSPVYINVIILLFLSNLGLLGLNIKSINQELLDLDHVDKIILQYADILEHLESTTFRSPRLISLFKKLTDDPAPCSKKLRVLSKHLQKLDSVNNGVVVAILSGLAGYHLHVFKKVCNWRDAHGAEIETWLEVIGEFEMLSSLANMAYNNPDYCHPHILEGEGMIQMEQMGHPLIDPTERICNDLAFESHKFVVLTGSNMSGKSTFLRSLGVNMVLANCGSVVCAQQAEITPMPVLVSMRIADSLNDHESYFFAEVNRLKYIMDQLEDKQSLVLLDEILRGTNSNDKRKGTLEVIKKLVSMNAIGIIATHDLAVCKIAESHPDYLTNMCFEADISGDNLTFDYKLREGICKNQSAVFLMKRTGVI